MLDQEVGQQRPHLPLPHGRVRQHGTRHFHGRQRPPGPARQFVGQFGGIRHRQHRLRFPQFEHGFELFRFSMAQPRPAAQMHRIAAGRIKRMATQQFTHMLEVAIGAPDRMERQLRLAFRRQPVEQARALVNAHGQYVACQQHIQAQGIFGREQFVGIRHLGKITPSNHAAHADSLCRHCLVISRVTVKSRRWQDGALHGWLVTSSLSWFSE